MNLIIDEGNTRVKLAVFQEETIQLHVVVLKEGCRKEIQNILEKYAITSVMTSSVTDEIQQIVEEFQFQNSHYLTHESRLPFENLYETPHTLGVDRIGLIAAAYSKFPDTNVLVIDAGSCITYDFIDKEGLYLGGSISPGIEMRFKAMNSFTGKLPLLTSSSNNVELLGKSTANCMQSGVINGTVFEIDGVIEAYKKEYKKLKIILTGGDANMLCKQLKNPIFVSLNFLLEGLNSLLIYQLENDKNR